MIANSSTVQEIIDRVRNDQVKSLTTNIIPTTKDVMSANIILNHCSSVEILEANFANTAQWLADLQKKDNWQNVLQDILLLAKTIEAV